MPLRNYVILTLIVQYEVLVSSIIMKSDAVTNLNIKANGIVDSDCTVNRMPLRDYVIRILIVQ